VNGTSASSVRLGCGSAYSEDRIDLAVDMVDRGGVDYLAMDGLAERTLALAHQRRDPVTGAGGYDTRLAQVARDLLPAAARRGVKIITNMGAANPSDAAEYLATAARSHGLRDLQVAVIEGDDVAAYVAEADPLVLETGDPISMLPGAVIAANAYIGAEPIVEALRSGASVIIGGRIADPSLFVAPIAYELGWDLDDWERLGQATVVGHLLECGTYVTGGNFADPPFRVVESFERPSFPLAEIHADGRATIAKLPDTDGLLSVETCKMQLGYEIGDPSTYLTPDVTADFRNVTLEATPGGIAVAGATGRERPGQLKALVAIAYGFVGEGQVSFAGPGALSRAELGRDTVRKWLRPILADGNVDEFKFDIIGVDSMHGVASPPADRPYEVHLRLVCRSRDRQAAESVADALWRLQIFGPAAVGGHRKSITPVVGMFSFFLPRDAVRTTVRMIQPKVAIER
jgi:hypothetical protein